MLKNSTQMISNPVVWMSSRCRQGKDVDTNRHTSPTHSIPIIPKRCLETWDCNQTVRNWWTKPSFWYSENVYVMLVYEVWELSRFISERTGIKCTDINLLHAGTLIVSNRSSCNIVILVVKHLGTNEVCSRLALRRVGVGFQREGLGFIQPYNVKIPCPSIYWSGRPRAKSSSPAELQHHWKRQWDELRYDLCLHEARTSVHWLCLVAWRQPPSTLLE